MGGGEYLWNRNLKTLKEFNERFKPAMLGGKLVNIGDDMSDQYIMDSAMLKKITSGGPITVENKGEDPRVIENYATQIFSANIVPRIKDPTEAVIDRIIFIPFNARFEKKAGNFEPNLKDEILKDEESMEYVLQLGLKGLLRVLKNEAFSTIPETEALKEQ